MDIWMITLVSLSFAILASLVAQSLRQRRKETERRRRIFSRYRE
jgi:hypothetical protein